MAYSFGRTSHKRMLGVDDALTRTAVTALSFSPIDMSIPWRGGLRTASQQKELFDMGNSRADGYRNKSYHQSGKALDIVPFVDGEIDYTATDRFVEFANLMLETFKFLQAIGQIPRDLYLHWGGFWSAKDNNGDGILSTINDEFGWDKPHWEIRTKPQTKALKIVV